MPNAVQQSADTLQLKQKYSICTILLWFRFKKQMNTGKSAASRRTNLFQKRTSACNLLLLQTSCTDLVCKCMHAFIHDGNFVSGHKNEGLCFAATLFKLRLLYQEPEFEVWVRQQAYGHLKSFFNCSRGTPACTVCWLQPCADHSRVFK